jgi:hypothetical protein
MRSSYSGFVEGMETIEMFMRKTCLDALIFVGIKMKLVWFVMEIVRDGCISLLPN